MKSSTKWAIGAAVLLGVGVLVVGGAAAAAEPDEHPDKGKGLSDSGVRHGLKYEGCAHFELHDADAVEAWAMQNKLKFAKYALALDEVKADPAPAMAEAFALLFPECPWPPPPETTFGPDRLPWSEAVAQVKVAIQNADMAPAAAGPMAKNKVAAALIGDALALALRGGMG